MYYGDGFDDGVGCFMGLLISLIFFLVCLMALWSR